jgi:hypothetical protein
MCCSRSRLCCIVGGCGLREHLLLRRYTRFLSQPGVTTPHRLSPRIHSRCEEMSAASSFASNVVRWQSTWAAMLRLFGAILLLYFSVRGCGSGCPLRCSRGERTLAESAGTGPMLERVSGVRVVTAKRSHRLSTAQILSMFDSRGVRLP